MYDPPSTSLVEGNQVVSDHTMAPGEQRGRQRRLAQAAVAEKGDSATIDLDHRPVQRITAEREKGEREDLSQEKHAERLSGGLPQPSIEDPPAVVDTRNSKTRVQHR